MKYKLKAIGYFLCMIISYASAFYIVYTEVDYLITIKPNTITFDLYGDLTYLMLFIILLALIYTVYSMFNNCCKAIKAYRNEGIKENKL